MKQMKALRLILTIPSILVAVAVLTSEGRTSSPVSTPVAAEADLRFLPVSGPEQEAVKAAILRGEARTALGLWNSAYATSPFANTASGYAFQSFLIFKSGLEVSGVEHLFLLKNPNAISPEVRKLWQAAAAPNHPVWKLAQIRWNSSWTSVFAGFSGQENIPFQSFSIRNASELKKIEKAIAGTKPDTNERAWAQWQLALWAGIYNQTAVAKNQLNSILNSKQTLFDSDQIHVAKARILFQESDLKGALAEYQTLRKSSDYWLESLEERAWTYMRLGQPEKALGELKTVLSPVFTPQVGPEPFFLQAFVNLKVCDYPQIFKTLEDFKKRYRSRAVEMQALARDGKTPAAEQAIAKLDRTALSWNSVGVNSSALPRYFHRDEVIAKQMGLRQALIHDADAIRELSAKSPSLLTGSSIATRNLNNLLAQVPARAEQAKTRVFGRLKTLAAGEVDEMATILQKMHIIEAESIERIHLVQQGQFKKESQTVASHSDDELVFPVRKDDKEMWVDELDKFQYVIKGCPNQKGKTL